MQILINHIGYASGGSKSAVLECRTADSIFSGREYSLINTLTGETAFSGRLGEAEEVSGWRGRIFYPMDFSRLCVPGVFRVEIPSSHIPPSFPFRIAEGLPAEACISDILFYYKSQRCSGRWEAFDRAVPFFGERAGTADLRGGWYDASGDYSKYLSHLSYANYLNPQQTPLVVLTLLSLFEGLGENSRSRGTLLQDRAAEEGLWGADFLMRMQDETGFFYMTVFDQWDKDPEKRMVCAYRGKEGLRLSEFQAGFRQGGGLSIAALAAASRTSRTVGESLGSYSADAYIEAAEKGYRHLLEKNREYLDNGRENIIDFYCGLTAAVELFRTTGKGFYLEESRRWAEFLRGCFNEEEKAFMVESSSDRPFFHASDAGMPLLSLCAYCRIEEETDRKADCLTLIKTGLLSELDRTEAAEGNPFSLARQRVKPVNGAAFDSFFIPHDNESGYWWQGENARLASLAAAAREASRLLGDKQLSIRAERYALAQLDWILGLNPFDVCMLQGHGRNNPAYEEHYPNAPGGICNGITGGFEDEKDLDFLPDEAAASGDHRWRWSEQWIPHAAWFLQALLADRGNWSS